MKHAKTVRVKARGAEKQVAGGRDYSRSLPRHGTSSRTALSLMRLGLDDGAVLAALRAAFPGSRTTENTVQWYRWKFTRDGVLRPRRERSH